jgi:hypothetical protein
MSEFDDYALELRAVPWWTKNQSESYETARICLNGHTIDDSPVEFPEHNQGHFSYRGKRSLTKCPNSEIAMRGHLRGSLFEPTSLPAFCHKCSEPYTCTGAESELHVKSQVLSMARTKLNENFFPAASMITCVKAQEHHIQSRDSKAYMLRCTGQRWNLLGGLPSISLGNR